MSIFNLFRRSKQIANQKISGEHQGTPSNSVKVIDQSLFVDEQKPEMKVPFKTQVNYIETFLEQKFEWQGYNDAYSYPEADFLETKLKLIRADFRYAVDKCLDLKRSELGELKLHMIKTTGISPRLEAQLNEKIKQLEINIHELDTQKILSVADEGIISSAIHAYRLGFVKGLEKFQVEKLFAGCTGLFN